MVRLLVTTKYNVMGYKGSWPFIKDVLWNIAQKNHYGFDNVTDAIYWVKSLITENNNSDIHKYEFKLGLDGRSATFGHIKTDGRYVEYGTVSIIEQSFSEIL